MNTIREHGCSRDDSDAVARLLRKHGLCGGLYTSNLPAIHPPTLKTLMPGPARSGVLIYAKNFEIMSSFYEKVLRASVLRADDEHRVLQSPDAQLIIHAIPPQYRESITIEVPPVAREEQAIKPFFTVESLEEAERIVELCGGKVWGPVWPSPGMRVRNICDPEGNIVHLREPVV